MRKGVIYIARCQEFYKIGYTETEPLQRLSSLQTGNPYRIELVGTTPARPQDERNLHAAYAHKRERGEWFKLTPDDVQSILSSPLHSVPQPRPVVEKERAIAAIKTSAMLDGLRYLPAEQVAEFLGEVRKIAA